MTTGLPAKRCSCKDVELKEGQEERRQKGIIHTRMRCKPVPTEEDIEAGADPEPVKKRGKKAKVKKVKRYKSFMSNGLKNALVVARHGSAFEEQLAPYQNRKADQELIAWAATHTCAHISSKWRGMRAGGKRFNELVKFVRKQSLRLACGCPCTGVPLATPTPQFPMLGEDEAGSRACCECPQEGSAAWDLGERCEDHKLPEA